MKKLIIVCMLALTGITSLFAQNLTKSQVKPDTVKQLINPEYTVFQYDDGDIKVSYDGVNILIMTDEERSLIKFRTFWMASNHISLNRSLKLVNNWNENKVFTTAIYGENDDGSHFFALEYFITTYGGLNADNLNDTLDWIFSLADGFATYLNEEDALED